MKAEAFVKDLEAVDNRELSVEAMKEKYGAWTREVRDIYFKVTDASPAPVERAVWAEAILELAGWVADMTLLFVYNEKRGLAAEKWMKRRAVRNYYDALEKLRHVERRCIQNDGSITAT